MSTRKYLMLGSLMVIVLIFSGCAAPVQKAAFGPVFYPEAPELPRLQYLTSYTSQADIEAGKSSFELFVTGEKERLRRLDKPYGVAIYDGKIYVCDTNATVMVFDLEKKTYGQLAGAKGLGKLVQPINISIDSAGNKYVSDPIRGQVVAFDKNDFYVNSYGVPGEWKPVDAVSYGDLLYVADSKNAEIRVYDKATGNIIKRIGSKQEAGEGQLGIPTNLAFDKEGRLYVSDAGRFQIVKFDRDGHFLGTIGSLGTAPGSFARPRGITFDRDDRLYAVDAAFDNVQIFDQKGRSLLFFGKGGRTPGDLYLAAGIFVDYNNVRYFQQYVDPRFEADGIVLVTSQFGEKMVNVYALGKEKGKKYPTDEEVAKEIEEKRKLEKKDQKPPAKEGEEAGKPEEGGK